MPKKLKPVPDTARLSLATALDLREAAPLTERLLANRGRDLEIDASEVQRLGAQCLQVLLAARQAWSADGKRFVVAAPSPAVVATLALLGVSLVDLHHQPEVQA